MLLKTLLRASALSLALALPAQADSTGREHIIIVTGFSYFPAITFAKPGDTVRFVNQSGGTETVVGRDTGWIVGPLEDQQEGALVITEETELAFFSAYQDCGACTAGEEDPDADSGTTDPYGSYDDAAIKAEISFDAPDLETTLSEDG